MPWKLLIKVRENKRQKETKLISQKGGLVSSNQEESFQLAINEIVWEKSPLFIQGNSTVT